MATFSLGKISIQADSQFNSNSSNPVTNSLITAKTAELESNISSLSDALNKYKFGSFKVDIDECPDIRQLYASRYRDVGFSSELFAGDNYLIMKNSVAPGKAEYQNPFLNIIYPNVIDITNCIGQQENIGFADNNSGSVFMSNGGTSILSVALNDGTATSVCSTGRYSRIRKLLFRDDYVLTCGSEYAFKDALGNYQWRGSSSSVVGDSVMYYNSNLACPIVVGYEGNGIVFFPTEGEDTIAPIIGRHSNGFDYGVVNGENMVISSGPNGLWCILEKYPSETTDFYIQSSPTRIGPPKIMVSGRVAVGTSKGLFSFHRAVSGFTQITNKTTSDVFSVSDGTTEINMCFGNGIGSDDESVTSDDLCLFATADGVNWVDISSGIPNFEYYCSVVSKPVYFDGYVYFLCTDADNYYFSKDSIELIKIKFEDLANLITINTIFNLRIKEVDISKAYTEDQIVEKLNTLTSAVNALIGMHK